MGLNMAWITVEAINTWLALIWLGRWALASGGFLSISSLGLSNATIFVSNETDIFGSKKLFLGLLGGGQGTGTTYKGGQDG